MHDIAYVEVVDPVFKVFDPKQVTDVEFEGFVLFDEGYLRVVFIDETSEDVLLF